jgi:hypothetical protein
MPQLRTRCDPNHKKALCVAQGRRAFHAREPALLGHHVAASPLSRPDSSYHAFRPQRLTRGLIGVNADEPKR